jgi:hypothetical protein
MEGAIMYIKKEAYVWEYRKLEKLIEDTYGIKKYSIPAEEECRNDVALTYNVVPHPQYDWDEEELINPSTCVVRILLNAMHSKGIIPAGYHVVEVMW